MATIDQTLDTIMQLDASSREMLLEILYKRQIDEKRKEIARNGKQAKQTYNSGKTVAVSASDVISTLNAL